MFISLVHLDTLSVEATVRKAPNGDLIVVCTCGGNREPAPENRTYLFRSTDNGATWSEKQMLNTEDGMAHYHTCTAIVGGEIWVFISRHDGYFSHWTNYMLISGDSGCTWKKRELKLLPEYAFVRSMSVLSDGNLILPYHAYPVTRAYDDECRARGSLLYKEYQPFTEIGLLVSKDGGKSFEKIIAHRQTEDELRSVSLARWSWTENSIAEIQPGHLAMIYRIDGSGWLWRMDSKDFGKTWQPPFKTDIPNPSNKPHLLNGRKGEIILINTPCNTDGIFYLRKRFPLEVWISYDGMKTWGKKIRVSDFPGAYSYADGFVDGDGHLKIAFEFNRHDIYYADIDLDKD